MDVLDKERNYTGQSQIDISYDKIKSFAHFKE